MHWVLFGLNMGYKGFHSVRRVSDGFVLGFTGLEWVRVGYNGFNMG